MWNRLDPDILEPFLSESVRYESFETELCLEGKTAVLEHLRRKVGLIETAGQDARIRAELGWVESWGGGRKPCVISGQGDVDRSALFFVTLDADGRMDRIVLSTVDPDPQAAEPSGIIPR